MSYIFISDLHLDESRPEITSAFIDFIGTTASTADRLYILGDFFEVWLGDDDQSEFNAGVISVLAQLSMPRFIMHGNRDFLLGAAFCRQTGFELLPDPSRQNLFGKPVLLMHGDSLCTRDTAYMAVRKKARDPAFQRELLARSLEERTVFAGKARSDSGQHSRDTAMDIMDVTPEEVVKVMLQNDVPLLIHGHTHRPDVHEVALGQQTGQRVVLGDWDRQGWYLQMDEKSFSLHSFDITF